MCLGEVAQDMGGLWLGSGWWLQACFLQGTVSDLEVQRAGKKNNLEACASRELVAFVLVSGESNVTVAKSWRSFWGEVRRRGGGCRASAFCVKDTMALVRSVEVDLRRIIDASDRRRLDDHACAGARDEEARGRLVCRMKKACFGQ